MNKNNCIDRHVSNRRKKHRTAGRSYDAVMLKNLEEHIYQTRKLDSIRTLAGGVAHNFNNILTIIIGATALLERNVVNDPEQVKNIKQICDSADRGTKLAQSLLAFSCRQNSTRQTEDVGSIVKIMQEFLERSVGENILLTTYLPEKPLMVKIDRGQIEQVLMNLATNARDAMMHGGTLDITVSRFASEGTMLELEGCRSGDYALITFSDNGDGIDATTQQRIFEPFFSTKANSKGCGMGLSIAYGFVRQNDGFIHINSEPGVGTTFRIYLPLVD